MRSPLLRMTCFTLSWLLVLLGVVGVFLPVLPTTPFLLLASWFYARSSPRFYNWLMNHRHLGPPLRKWKENGSISRLNKIRALLLIWLSLGVSIVFFVPLVGVKAALLLTGLTLTWFLVSRPE